MMGFASKSKQDHDLRS